MSIGEFNGRCLLGNAPGNEGAGPAPPALFGVRRGLDRPARIGAERMIHEEHPGAVRQPAVDLHAVMMQLGGGASLSKPVINHCERVIAKSPATVV